MYSEQYEDRKRYVDAVKSSFSASGQTDKSAEKERMEYNRSEKEHRSFLGVRFILALCLFLAFFVIKQTDFSWKGWNAAKITSQIQNTVDLSGMLRQVQHILE